MSVIVPTITASNPHVYRDQIERVLTFAERLHIDFADGVLAPTELLPLDEAWLPANKTVDLHLMLKKPNDYLPDAIRLQPQLIIVHAEADDAKAALEAIKTAGLKCGLAVLPGTRVEAIQDQLGVVDHVLIFGGRLGYQGGEARLDLLQKVQSLRQKAPQLEIGWDGGINDQNISELITAGVDVLNTGGFIQRADDPATAYAKLLAVAESVNDEKTDS